MKLKAFFKAVLEKGNVGLGWFVFWRMALVIVPLNLIARMIAETTALNPAAGASVLFVLPIGGNFYMVPIAVPIVLFLWDFLGKRVMSARLGITPSGFIGWALYWRFVLMQLLGVLALALVFGPLMFLVQNFGETGALIFGTAFGIAAFAGLVYWNLNVIGFVVKKVAVTATPAARKRQEEAAAAKGLVRDYRALFDIPAFGMNWMFAAAYFAAGLVGMFIFPLVDAVLEGGLSFPPMSLLLPVIPNLLIGGATLAWLLHKVRVPWQVVGLFALVMVLTAALIEGPLSQALDPGAGEGSFFNPPQLVTRLGFAVFFCTGMLMGLKFRGPTFLGFALGIGAAELVYFLLINPLVWGAFLDIEIDFLFHPEQMIRSTLITVIDAAITGAALWWACQWHLKRRGLGLSPDGAIVSAP